MTNPQPPTQADTLAKRMKLGVVSEELREELDAAIQAAEADVEGYLGRPIRPVTKVAERCWPVPGGWDIPTEHGRIRDIVSATPEVVQGVDLGTFTVTYTVGIDYLNDPDMRPIGRYVMAAAQNDPVLAQWLAGEGVGPGRGRVKSVSVSTEGQSKNVTYADVSYGGGGAAGADSPGALPARSTLDRWKVANRRVVQAPDRGYDSRLHGGGQGYRDNDGFWNRR